MDTRPSEARELADALANVSVAQAAAAVGEASPWHHSDEVIRRWLRGEVIPGLSLRLALVECAAVPARVSTRLAGLFGRHMSEPLAAAVRRLCAAVETGSCAAVKGALAGGVPIDGMDATGRCALARAVEGGHLEVASLLFDWGATPTAFTRHAGVGSAWRMALARGSLDWVELFLSAGAPPAGSAGGGRTSFEVLAEAPADDPRALDALFRAERFGVSILAAALPRAARAGNPRIVRYCIDQGVHPDARDAERRSALHIAARAGHAEVVERLLQAGAAVMGTDPAGETPLGLAAESGHLEVARQLLDAGADPERKNAAGRKPADRLPASLRDPSRPRGPSWHDPDGQYMLFVYHKAFGLGFDPRKLDAPIMYGGDHDGLMHYDARYCYRDWVRADLLRNRMSWFYEFIDKLATGGDFTVDEVAAAARKAGFRPFARRDIR
jgi:cytohesin